MFSIASNPVCICKGYQQLTEVAYQIKWNHMVATILPTDPHLTPTTLVGMVSIGQNSIFSEHGHVAYQIKWNHEMQRHGSKYFACLPPPPSHDPSGWGQ